MKKTAIIKEFLTIALFIIVCIVFGTFVKADYEVKKENEYIDVNQNATLYINDELVCIGNITKYDLVGIKYGDEITVKVSLDNARIKNPVITFNNNMDLGYRINVNGKKIADVGMNADKNQVIVNNQIRIPLNLKSAKGNLEMVFRCTNKNVFNIIPRVICINSMDEMPNFIISNFEYIIMGFGLIEMGLLCILFMCVNVVLKIVNTKMVYIAMSCISTGIWILSCYQIIGMAIDNTKMEFYIEYIGLASTILFLSLYIRELYEENIERNILMGNAVSVIIITIVIIILQMLDLVYMNDSVVGIQICFIPTVVLMLKKYFIIMKEKNISIVTRSAEVVMILGVLVYYLVSHSTKEGLNVLNFVILVIIAVLVQAMKNIVTEMQDRYVSNAERKSIAKLAFLDTLTGLSNRRALDSYIENIVGSPNGKKYKVCSFDLNRLKKTNDTYGHAAGDILIKSFANELRESLLINDNFVGRMGGDEFIAIINDKNDGKELDDMHKLITQKNQNGEYEYKVKYSVGIVDYINDGSMDIHNAIRMADYAMYEMKSLYSR